MNNLIFILNKVDLIPEATRGLSFNLSSIFYIILKYFSKASRLQKLEMNIRKSLQSSKFKDSKMIPVAANPKDSSDNNLQVRKSLNSKR
jgi:hypothetical protein